MTIERNAAGWLRDLGASCVGHDVLLFTAEQMHLMCLLTGIGTVPGLGPLPIDATAAGERLMRSTALRALRARGAVECDEDGVAVLRSNLEKLLLGLSKFDVSVRAARVRSGAGRSRVWAAWDQGAASVSAVTLTDYRLERMERTRLADDLLEFVTGDGLASDAIPAPAIDNTSDSKAAESMRVARALRDGTRLGIWVMRPRRAVPTTQIRLLTDHAGHWWQIHVNGELNSDSTEPAVSELGSDAMRALVADLVNADG